MSDDESGKLVERWRQGDQDAAAALFRRYAERLIGLARSRLSARLNGRVDPEDVVQSAFRSFFVETREGRHDFEHGGDLWRLLVTMTLHKVQHQVERHTAGKRAVQREQAFGGEDSLLGLQAEVLTREPSVVEAVALADELEALMQGLEPLQRRMLELRLQGHNLEEIAVQTHRSQRTVCRVLDQVKDHLQRHPQRVSP
ncbi:hypothetical protein AYO40_06465 [Planctomycetaceae bacterium SCGC AG-212-D15]|nr:hypothetical protein AYO40_06465 [Planctomycetaceae bacterium SCGC AG-212-D15]